MASLQPALCPLPHADAHTRDGLRAQYAIYIGWRQHKPAAMSGPAATLVAGLAFLNGQYYMQKVVANAAIKTSEPTPGC